MTNKLYYGDNLDVLRESVGTAASAGFYEMGGRKFLKLQLLTAAQVIDGKRPQIPFGHTESL